MMNKKKDWYGPLYWPKAERKKESWEILTPEQIERYDRELASDNWKNYEPQEYGRLQKRN